MSLSAFLSPVNGIVLKLCFPRISPHGTLFEGAFIYENEFLGGASRIYGNNYKNNN